MKQAVTSSAAMLAAPGLLYSQEVQGQKKEAVSKQKLNFIFILADDLGWGELGCYGHPHVKTPNLDRLAQKGIKFDQFYVPSPVCSPTRVGIMTGQYPSRHGVHAQFSSPEWNERWGLAKGLDPDVPSVTRTFQQQGYRTGHIGKWHLCPPPRFYDDGELPTPEEYGIDYVAVPDFNWKSFNIRKHKPYSTKMYVEKAVEFIESTDEQPFYLQLWLNDIHVPLQPTEQQLQEHYPGIPPTDPFAISWTVITEMDKQLGVLFDYLEETGLDKNTVVIFTSDNGPTEAGDMGKRRLTSVGYTGVFRGRKGSLYEGGLRVPFIVSCPSCIPQGQTDQQTVLAGIDMLPTLTALAGIKLPAQAQPDGQDMSAAILGQRTIPDRKPIFWEYWIDYRATPLHASPYMAVREGKWVFLMNPDGSKQELYDVLADPSQVDNKTDTHPEVAARLKETLLKIQATLPKNRWHKQISDAGSDWDFLKDQSSEKN